MSSTPAERGPLDALREREARLAIVAGAIADAIVVADASGRITMWTGAAERIFGWQGHEAVGRPLTDLMPERYHAAHRRGFDRVLGGGKPTLVGRTTVELEALHRDGFEFAVELSLSRGEIDGEQFFVGVVRDISGRRSAEEQLRLAQERFRSAFEHAAIGVTLSGPDGRYLRVNRAFGELLGYSEHELAGMRLLDVTHPADAAADATQLQQLISGQTEALQTDKRYVRKDGRPVWVSVSVSLVRTASGEPLHFITQVEDISERKRAQHELERSNSELAQFAFAASHDLSEPLRIVGAYVRALGRRYSDVFDAEGRELLQQAISSVARMRALIDELLSYARVGAAEPHREALDARNLARGVIDELRVLIQESDGEIVLGELPDLYADALLLRRILQNLVTNAIKHARPGVPPRVRIAATRVDAAWCISIADNGPGIPAPERERVFELFGRGSTETPYSGTGLGLAIARRAVERLGGRIWVQDTELGGADVRFTIPTRMQGEPPDRL